MSIKPLVVYRQAAPPRGLWPGAASPPTPGRVHSAMCIDLRAERSLSQRRSQATARALGVLRAAEPLMQRLF
jgi:hypothetical protein